jgi:hypothetical protein
MSDAPASSSSSSSSSNSSLDDAPAFLNREEQTAPLVEKITLSHDTYLFRFAAHKPSSLLFSSLKRNKTKKKKKLETDPLASFSMVC